MGGPQGLTESSPDSRLRRHLDLAVKPKRLQGPADRVGDSPSRARRRLARQEVREQRRPDLAPPRQSSAHCPEGLIPEKRRRQTSRVSRAEHQLAGCGPGAVELAGELIVGPGPAPVQPLTATGEAYPILLQPMPQPGLGNGPLLPEFVDELNDLSKKVTGELRPEAGTHPTEKQAAEAGAGAVLRAWKPGPADGDPASGGYRSGVEDLQFGQQHPVKLPDQRSRRSRRLPVVSVERLSVDQAG